MTAVVLLRFFLLTDIKLWTIFLRWVCTLLFLPQILSLNLNAMLPCIPFSFPSLSLFQDHHPSESNNELAGTANTLLDWYQWPVPPQWQAARSHLQNTVDKRYSRGPVTTMLSDMDPGFGSFYVSWQDSISPQYIAQGAVALSVLY